MRIDYHIPFWQITFASMWCPMTPPTLLYQLCWNRVKPLRSIGGVQRDYHWVYGPKLNDIVSQTILRIMPYVMLFVKWRKLRYFLFSKKMSDLENTFLKVITCIVRNNRSMRYVSIIQTFSCTTRIFCINAFL